ncbi:MAG: glycoside hydrolase family 3 N-terminal domain-containing protein [Bacteroidota bacterium]
MTKYSIFLVLSFYLPLIGCSQTSLESQDLAKKERVKQTVFELSDFLEDNKDLDEKVDLQLKKMSDSALVAQLIMPATGRLGLPKEDVEKYTRKGIIGGVLMLNGTVDEFTTWIKEFEEINKKKGYLPFLYSADAEPSLVNRKITGSTQVKKAQEVKSLEEATEVAKLISADLNKIGINYNFAPVVDVSTNATVGYRGFGAKKENLIPWSKAFITETQKNNIIATAKHFPGHGLVSGDTHKSLQTINGELKELENYPPLIADGVLSIMIAHIAIQNNKLYDTKGMPATTSETVVTELLRKKLGFKGLIVTDAMNMGGVSKVPNASEKAINAGCDIVLMPLDIEKSFQDIYTRMKSDKAFRIKVEQAAKRVIRMKVCLGLVK